MCIWNPPFPSYPESSLFPLIGRPFHADGLLPPSPCCRRHRSCSVLRYLSLFSCIIIRIAYNVCRFFHFFSYCTYILPWTYTLSSTVSFPHPALSLNEGGGGGRTRLNTLHPFLFGFHLSFSLSGLSFVSFSLHDHFVRLSPPTIPHALHCMYVHVRQANFSHSTGSSYCAWKQNLGFFMSFVQASSIYFTS